MPPRPSASAPGMATKRIKKEIADLSKENLGAISLQPNESNIFNWKAILPGPTGSPYEGGVFEVDIKVPEDYPFSPPHLHFVTKVYHCNIASTGAICLDLLKHAWSPALSLYKVILSLSSLLTDPNPADPLVPAIAQEYKRDRKKHDATAREWVKKYATPKQAPPSPIPTTKASTSRPKLLNRPSSSTTSASASTPIPQIAGTRRPASTRDTIDLASDSDEGESQGDVSIQVLGNSSRSTVVNGTNGNGGERRDTKRTRLNNAPAGGGGGSVGDAIVIDE
ncbi:ubiquitin-conjugating enzyme 4 [Kwoniella mangroviensis CBS 10435]|uniref:Ubiquitin-conjugating enzyme 4 n=1 Tax=Kwoniella mangroviensis CBS 10435 TaxID=1331196 RepID=A0A1B9IH59_9TREE|nr:ubiquitin-conjugating enzyme 4 [Kwoniella mangroviensis CBS 8507]OCF55018.1 ubiquitin-conjugating enzyme 4 [Kwoniella mangroviensis CBS 10435]OCF67793.1 ubiquitin-conjugating enzyme 4 [Kwoniella mangroviensis CBS 8507]